MIYSRTLANKMWGEFISAFLTEPETVPWECSEHYCRHCSNYMPTLLNLLFRWIDFLANSRASENLATLHQVTRSPFKALCGHGCSGWSAILGGWGPIFPKNIEGDEKRPTAFVCSSLSLAVTKSLCCLCTRNDFCTQVANHSLRTPHRGKG